MQDIDGMVFQVSQAGCILNVEMNASNCEFCSSSGGDLIWQDALCRVVHINDPGYAGFCRVIWNDHIREMSDLRQQDRDHLMRVVVSVEQALLETLHPLKINLASLGNITPHLHWHVIPRFADDRHFPKPIWGEPQRDAITRALPENWMNQMSALIDRQWRQS